MPLPQLNTQGIDITNTLMKMKQMDAMRAEEEDRRIAAGQRNAMFELQKRKADYELSPEVVDVQKKMAVAKLATENALAQEHALKAQLAITDQLARAMKSVPYDSELKHYSAFRSKMLEHPLFGNSAKLLPDEKDFLKPDMRSESGFSVPAEDAETFKKVYTSLATTVEELAEGKKPGTPTKIQVPSSDGSMKTVIVGTKLSDGEVFDPAALYGPGARIYEEDKGEKAPKKAESIKVKGEDGEIYEVTRHWDTDKKAYVEDGRIKVKDLTSATTKTPTEKDATVEATFVNKAGAQIVQMKDGSQWKQSGGERVPVSDDDLIGLQRIGDVMSPVMQEYFDKGKEGKSEEKKSSWISDTVKEAGDVVKAKFNKKPDEEGVVSKKVVGQPVSQSSSPKEVKTKEERDALPAGAIYIYNGVKYRKQ